MSYNQGTGVTHQTIRRTMRTKRWWSPLDLQQAVHQATGQLYTDATLTRRLREMPDIVCQRKIKDGKQRWEYRLVKAERKAA